MSSAAVSIDSPPQRSWYAILTTYQARSAQEKANLARIRDNQRRSRARRKEYLQELENRVRQCELQGIEASTEIQIAARRVSEENRKLRLLLNQSGIFDDMIEHHLATTASVDSIGGTGQAVATLEALLQPRKPTGPGGATFTAISRDTSIGSLSTTQSSVWDQPVTSVHSSSGHKRHRSTQSLNRPHSSTPSNTHNQSHPKSNVNQAHNSNLPLNQRGNMLASSHGQMNRQKQLQSSNSISPGIPSMYDPKTFELGSQDNNSYDSNNFYFQPSSTHSSHNNFDLPHQSSSNPLQQDVRPQPQEASSGRNSQNHSPVNNFGADMESNFDSTLMNTSSCMFAADMIGTMAGRMEEDVRAELGCSTSGDCDVSDEIVFGVMERYT